MSKALVTGGAGFIGSHLCEKLLAEGWDVCTIDNLSTGRYKNIKHLEEKENFRVIIDTVLDQSLMESLVREVDVIFHLASAVGVQLIIQEPVKTIETIIGGTEVVLNLARRYRKKVLITSTSEVYGKASKLPFSEQDDTVHGPTTMRRWAYAAAKAVDEYLAFAHWYETHLPVVCVRLFNTVGPRQTGQYGMVIPRFVNQALRGEPITVYGDGEQSRSFGSVHDIVPALVKLVDCPDALGKAVNIGNNEEVTMNALAEKVKKKTGSESPIVHIPYEQAYVEGFEDMRRRLPDISLAKRLIGFEPKYSLDATLDTVIEYYRQQG